MTDPTPAAPTSVSEISDADLTRAYVTVRDALDKIDAAYKANTEDLKQKMGLVTNELASRMAERGCDSLRTEYATVSMVSTRTAHCTDWEGFTAWVLETGRTDFFQRRLNTSPVNALVDDDLPLPPGVVTQTTKSLRVRRATAK